MTRIVWPALVLWMSLVSTTTAHAGPHGEYYEGDDPNPAPLKYPDATLHATLMQELERKKVKTVKNLTSGASDIAKFSRTEKVAALYVLGAKPGAEMDVMIEENGQYVPVQTYWDGDTITFKSGTPRAELYGKPSSKEEIQKKYGVGAFVDSGATWDAASLYIIETALSTLTKAELGALAGLPFHRMVKDPRNKAARGVVIGMYVPELAQIELYDHAIEADRRKFYGAVESPTPMSVATMVHEFGHAISRAGALARRRQAIETKKEYEAINAKIAGEKKKYDEDKATYNKTKDAALGKSLSDRAPLFKQLMGELAAKKKSFETVSAQMVQDERKGSALEQALDAKLPFKSAPTIYGRTSAGESFAECLAIFKLDRAALERAAPGIAAWFDSPAYAATLKASAQ